MKKEQATIEKDGFEISSGFRIRPQDTKAGARYQVDLGRKSGKHVRKNFEFLKDARKWAYDQHIKRLNTGLKASNFTDTQKADAVEALDILKEFGVNLRTAAQFYAKKNQKVTDENRFSTLVDCYLDSMKKRKLRPATITDAKTRMSPFSSAWADLAIDAIEAKDIDALLDERGFEGTNRDNYLRRLEAFFNWAIKAKVSKSNPAIQCEAITVEWEMPEVYRPSQVKAIFRMAENGEQSKEQPPRHELIPYFAVLFFAGVRPMEAARLKWSDLDLDAGEIHIRAGQSKTRTARLAPISDNLKAWLLKYRPADSEGQRILPCGPASLAKWRRALFSAAGVPKITDGARHSFATYALAKHGLDYTIEALGHGDAQMLMKHYKALITNRKAAAEKFFDILPLSTTKTIIFPKARCA